MESAKIIQLVTVHMVSALAVSLLWVLLSENIAVTVITSAIYRDLQKSTWPSRILIGIFYYVIMALVNYLIIYYQNFREKIEKEASVNTLLKEAELNALKLQINPHFIFNSLNSVNSLIMVNPDMAQEMVVKLSDFLRSTLSGSSKHLVTLREEIDFSKLYLEIEKIRFGNKLNFVIEMENECNEKMIPHMLFQPLLENAVKHGVQQSSQPVVIKLVINYKNDFLRIVIKNNFEGISHATGKKIGLKNIKDRLALIYNRSDLITIEEKNQEFIVSLTIPA